MRISLGVSSLALVLLALTFPAAAQVRVFIADRIAGSPADLISAIADREECAGIRVSGDISRAEFIIEIGRPHQGGFLSDLGPGNGVTVYNGDGDVIYSGATHQRGNAIKDACVAIRETIADSPSPASAARTGVAARGELSQVASIRLAFSMTFDGAAGACRPSISLVEEAAELVLRRASIPISSESGLLDENFSRRVAAMSAEETQRAYALRPHTAFIGLVGTLIEGLCAVGWTLEVVRPEAVPVIGGGVRSSPVLAYSTAGVRAFGVSDIEPYFRELARQVAAELANAVLEARSN